MRKLYRTKRLFFEVVPQVAELGAQYAVVELGVVRHEYAAVGDLDDALGHLIKLGRTAQHGIIDAGKLHHKGLYGFFGVDQAEELVYHLMTIIFINGNFGDPFFVKLPAGSFYVEYCVQKILSKYYRLKIQSSVI